MDINSWIEEVHRNKHNMIPVVKLAISKPIEALLETTNLTNDFPISLLPVIKSKKNEADDIMSYLSSIGSTETTKEDEVVQLEKQIEFVVNSIIPKIKAKTITINITTMLIIVVLVIASFILFYLPYSSYLQVLALESQYVVSAICAP